MGPAKKALMVAAITLASCSSQAIPAATPTNENNILRLSTTITAAPLINHLAHSYSTHYPDVTFEITSQTHQMLMQQLDNHEVNYVVSQHYPSQRDLWAAPLTQDGIAIITHPDNLVPSLSIKDIRAIYTGQITNWYQVAPDNPQTIHTIGREAGSADLYEFDRLILGGYPLFSAVRIAPSSEAMIEIVSQNTNTIGYVSASALQSHVKTIPINGIALSYNTLQNSTYPLRTTLFVISRREPKGPFRQFIGWVQSPQGQATVQDYFSTRIP